MLCHNMKELRRAKGLSQEELAMKLNVVRQTISKWEKGLSVPDAEMLIEIADSLETSVDVLLGETVSVSDESDAIQIISGKLELLNQQLAKRNELNRKIWRLISLVTGVIVTALIFFNGLFHMNLFTLDGSDGPTSVFLSINMAALIIFAVLFSASIIGIFLTRRKQK